MFVVSFVDGGHVPVALWRFVLSYCRVCTSRSFMLVFHLYAISGWLIVGLCSRMSGHFVSKMSFSALCFL